MKKTMLSIVAAMSISITVWAQAPNAFKYQAVARDAAGNIIANKNVGFKISILKSSTTGNAVYAETHAATTNEFGLVNLGIGNGSLVSGNIATIDWGADNYFIKIEMDAAGGSNYLLMGTSQLMSVPYAMYAKTSGNGQGPKGDKGIQGAKGDSGVAGKQGIQGIQGIKGLKGDSGVAGKQGIQGIQGVRGDKGDTGQQGIQGIQGVQGVKGDKGDKGDTGLQGIQGVAGKDADTTLWKRNGTNVFYNGGVGIGTKNPANYTITQ